MLSFRPVRYLIFISCLFNPHYARIHRYRKCIQYLLYFMVIVLMLSIVTLDIQAGLLLLEIDSKSYIDSICITVWSFTDMLLSVSCISLFFKPIWSRGLRHPKSQSVNASAARIYSVISIVQLIAAVSYQLTVAITTHLNSTVVSKRASSNFICITHVIQMCDCMLLMICVYIGFVRKRTV